MARLCPVCGSADKTFAHPKRHKEYTERGRLDVDDWYCHICKARWELWDYIREGVGEIKAVRLGNGNRQAWPDRSPSVCLGCRSERVAFVQCDGPWRGWANETLRYQCEACGEIWQEMVRIEDGCRLARRLWRQGATHR